MCHGHQAGLSDHLLQSWDPARDECGYRGPVTGRMCPAVALNRCGKPPPWLAADRGVDAAANAAVAPQARIPRAVIPYAGKPPPARVADERTTWVRRGCRLRAGSEGRISVWRRRCGLDRWRDQGAAGLGRWVGWGMVPAHLVKIAHTLAGRSARPLARAA
jgi:transposase, IS5 family